MAAADRPVNSGAVSPIPLQKFGIVVLIAVITIMLTVLTWLVDSRARTRRTRR